MKCVLLDKESLDIGDIDFSHVEAQCKELVYYDYTNPEQLRDRIQDADIVISNKVVLNESAIASARQLKLICVAATGYNNVDIDAAQKHSVAVCNVTGYATSSVVQHVFALILNLARSLPDYSNAVKQHKWQQSRQFCLLDYPIIDLQDKNLGILGYGELGHAVAEMGKAFGMNILIAESLTGRKQQGRIPLDEFFATSDIITLHCPLTEESKEIINQKTLALMKPTAFLINAARGGVVNEHDLWNALLDKQIAGAALDVVSKEPPEENILLDKPLPNLIITPHIAWASQKGRQKLVDEIGENIGAFNRGEKRNLIG